MIRELSKDDYPKLIEFLQADTITNYFILIGLEREKHKKTFEKIWGEYDIDNYLLAVLLKRTTGNMQFYTRSQFNGEEFSKILKGEGFNKLMVREDIGNELKKHYSFSKEEEGSFIYKLDREAYSKYIGLEDKEIKQVKISDIDRIIKLYERVFSGFSTKEAMVNRLNNKTGRGYYIESGDEIISITQSTLETLSSAIVVGVATDPVHRKKGLAKKCMIKLCSELLDEEKGVFLQYDNPDAGRLYEDLGFKSIGRMITLYN